MTLTSSVTITVTIPIAYGEMCYNITSKGLYLIVVVCLFLCQRLNVTLTKAIASHSTQVSCCSVTEPCDNTREPH